MSTCHVGTANLFRKSAAIVLILSGTFGTANCPAGALGWLPVVVQPPPDEQVEPSPYEGMTIRDIRINGLKQVKLTRVTNEIRFTTGDPYSTSAVSQSIRNLTRLNLFRRIGVEAESTEDGGVIVVFIVDEWPRVADVQVTGNVAIADQDIALAIGLRPGAPLDQFQIDLARERITNLYRERGHYLAEVSFDEKVLAESNIVLFRVREGPRVKIRQIDFRGNAAFPSKVLQPLLTTKPALFLLRVGQLDEQTLDEDVRVIARYHLDRGYLDVRVDRQIDLSNDLREARIIFLIDQGPLYTMRSVRVEGKARLFEQQMAALMEIKSGDVYSQDKIRKSVAAVRDALGRLGYVDVRIEADELRDSQQPFVDLLLRINQGNLARTGEIKVSGNTLTKRSVIMRELQIRPDRPLSTIDLAESQRRLRRTGLFGEVTITPLPRDEIDPVFRDVLVEVQETDTGSFNFGAGVSSDVSIFGTVSLEQRNFDIADFPESWSEFSAGRAFRGGGQTFSMAAQPGGELSNYSISLTEPYLFGTDNSLRSSFAFTQREQESFDQERLGGRIALGRRLGDVWSVSMAARWQAIELNDIDPQAPVAVFAVQDQNVVTGVGLTLTRTTVDDRIRPTRGGRLQLSVEQVGALGGDFDFTRLEAEHTLFLTLDEDFLGRKSVLSMRSRAGYLTGGETPIYERFFLGGRALRGFDFRTVAPKGIRNDTGGPSVDPIGGDWMFTWGLQYDFPIFAQFIGGVVFLDTGTVLEDLGFDDYRVAIGTGLRLFIPQFGDVPLAFDFALPIVSEADDDEKLFSFSVQLPFR